MFITNNHYSYKIILYHCKQKLRAAYKFLTCCYKSMQIKIKLKCL